MKYFSMFSGIGGLYESGMTQQDLATHYGVSQAQVSRVMKALGVKARVPKNLKQAGSDNASWEGNQAGYAALHYRVEKTRGKPKECEVCDTTTAKRYEWANINGNYADTDDYVRMCKSCHATFDGNINNIRKGAMR